MNPPIQNPSARNLGTQNLVPQNLDAQSLETPNLETQCLETQYPQAIIVHLLREGEWHQATLLYREETGAPRHLARREVERIAKQHAIQPKGTWWRWGVERSVPAVEVLSE